MIAIVTALDLWTSTEYSAVTKKLFGYCELARKTATGSEQPMPCKIADRSSERIQVSLNDQYSLITWVRLIGPIEPGNEIEGNDWGFGLDDGVIQRANLRFVVAHKVGLGEDWIQGFIKAIPSLLTVSGYEVVSINKKAISNDPDHEAVYRTELGETVYEKHRFTWNVYALTLPVEYKLCP